MLLIEEPAFEISAAPSASPEHLINNFVPIFTDDVRSVVIGSKPMQALGPVPRACWLLYETVPRLTARLAHTSCEFVADMPPP
jgi:hypothetical protein